MAQWPPLCRLVCQGVRHIAKKSVVTNSVGKWMTLQNIKKPKYAVENQRFQPEWRSLFIYCSKVTFCAKPATICLDKNKSVKHYREPNHTNFSRDFSDR